MKYILSPLFGLYILISIGILAMKRLLERSKRLPELEAQASHTISKGINF
jgi:hypothetical protein